MSVEASCPVFRCRRDSVAQCSGYRRTCERYYCQTHTKGTLCERCASLKQEDMKSTYRQLLNNLERKAYSSSLTLGVWVLFVVSLLLLVIAVVYWILLHNQDNLAVFVFSLGGGLLGLFGSLMWWVLKAREYMRATSVELDRTYPGFYDYYQQWQGKMNKVLRSSYFEPPAT